MARAIVHLAGPLETVSLYCSQIAGVQNFAHREVRSAARAASKPFFRASSAALAILSTRSVASSPTCVSHASHAKSSQVKSSQRDSTSLSPAQHSPKQSESIE